MEMPEEKCVGCTCTIMKGATARRQLYSPSTRHVLPAITSMFKELYNPDDVEKVLPSVESERCNKIFLCMKCFRPLERLMKLETEKNGIEKSLKAGIVKVGQYVNLQLKSDVSGPSQTPTCTRIKKRLRENSPPPATPSKRHRGPDTPTRHIIQSIHAPAGTPSVSVSFFLIILMS